jgi:hypothetical protein
MHFDSTITLGSIMQLIILLGALVKIVNSALASITRRMKAMERRVDLMWGWIVIQMTKEQREAWETWIRQHPGFGESTE